jgi:hypothetical protein
MADTPKKKKNPPKSAFEKIGSAYESEARRQEKAGNQDMAKKTRQAAAKSMTPENKKALEESEQASKSKKGKKVKKTEKVDAVEAAGAKAKDAVAAAKERNPIAQPASEGEKQGPPSPAGSKENTGSGPSTQRTPKPSKKEETTRRALPTGYGDYSKGGKDAETQRATDREFDRLEAEDKEKATERPNFGSVKEQREKNPPPNSAYPNFGSVAEQRAKAGPVQPSKLRAGAEGTSGKSGPVFRQNDITTEMPETRREKDEARTARIKELANSGVNKDPNDKGEMPDTPAPRQKPTVLVTPTKDGEMPKSDKPGFMSRLRSRMSSFSSRPGASAAPAAGGGSTPPPSAGGYPTPPPAPKQAGQAYGDVNTGTMNDYSVNKRSTDSNVSVGGDMNIGNVHNQNLKNSGGGITATTSGKARSTKAGITASTTGSATSSHPRAANASRGGRPTNRKK